MKKRNILMLVSAIVSLIILTSCCSTTVKDTDLQVLTPISSFQIKPSNAKYRIYKVEIEKSQYYLIRNIASGDFKIVPIYKSDNLVEIKDPYWNW